MNEHDLKERVEHLERIVLGNGELGIAQKTQIIWRAHVWILCTLSAAVGAAITIAIQKAMK